MRLSEKLLALSSTFVLSVLLLALALPVVAAPVAPHDAASLHKEANPPSGSEVMFGDTITYTVYITPSESTIQGLPFYFRDDLAPELEWVGFVGAQPSFGWDAATRAITSTQLVTTTGPMSVSFAAEVLPLMDGTGGMVVPIRNVAGLCTDPGTFSSCFDQSNIVEHETMTLYVIYLPLVTRNFSGVTAR
ncbi:MAG: hypothetical protein GVY30_10725 [Chloroflexi bacterium]|jgi:hypothetical protein|nr:hypothetical protein [Chloroflexota bacterium]